MEIPEDLPVIRLQIDGVDIRRVLFDRALASPPSLPFYVAFIRSAI